MLTSEVGHKSVASAPKRRLRLLRTLVGKRLRRLLNTLYHVHRVYPDDPRRALEFLRRGGAGRIGVRQRLKLLWRFYRISVGVDSQHSQGQMLALFQAMCEAPAGSVVEAGCYKGGSTAKLSIGAKLTGRRLHAFDSFQGIPENAEPHNRTISPRLDALIGGPAGPFRAGTWVGSLAEVTANVRRFGEIDVCRFVPGWFDDTMPTFTDPEPVAVVYLDVDLAASTRTCLKYLYPRMAPGGVLFSQDGALPLVVEVFRDEGFWAEQVGCPRPPMEGVGTAIMIKVTKPPAPAPASPGGSGVGGPGTPTATSLKPGGRSV